MSLGYPPVVGEAGQVEAKPYSEDILSVHRQMNYGDIATLLQFQRIPQEASEPSRWDCGGRNRADSVHWSCGKEPSPECTLSGILVETRTGLQSPVLENCPFLKSHGNEAST